MFPIPAKGGRKGRTMGIWVNLKEDNKGGLRSEIHLHYGETFLHGYIIPRHLNPHRK